MKKKENKIGILDIGKKLLLTKDIKRNYKDIKLSIKEIKTSIKNRKKEDKELKGLSFEDTLAKKMLKGQSKSDFIQICYKNNYTLFIYSFVSFLILLSFFIFNFSFDKGIIYTISTSLILLSLLVMQFTFSLRCYILKNEKLYITKQFIKDFKNYFPKRKIK